MAGSVPRSGACLSEPGTVSEEEAETGGVPRKTTVGCVGELPDGGTVAGGSSEDGGITAYLLPQRSTSFHCCSALSGQLRRGAMRKGVPVFALELPGIWKEACDSGKGGVFTITVAESIAFCEAGLLKRGAQMHN
jgi:hypothetical protein